MIPAFRNPVPPFSGWVRRSYRLSRPVTDEDVRFFLGNEELYVRETDAGTINIIHKYGLVEMHCVTGENETEVWYDPAKGSYSMEYLDALISTRF